MHLKFKYVIFTVMDYRNMQTNKKLIFQKFHTRYAPKYYILKFICHGVKLKKSKS